MAPSRYFLGRFVNETCFIRKNAEDFMRNPPRSCAGTPDQTLTGGLPLRRRSLYTTELQGQIRGGRRAAQSRSFPLGTCSILPYNIAKVNQNCGGWPWRTGGGDGQNRPSAPAVWPDGQALSACGGQRTRKAGEPRTAVIFFAFYPKKIVLQILCLWYDNNNGMVWRSVCAFRPPAKSSFA